MSEKNGLTADEELSLAADFGTADLSGDIEAAEDLEPRKGRKRVVAEPDEQESDDPSMADPGWSDFVMKQFAEDELDPDGRPLVAGLRRVTRLLLGPIVKSAARVVQAPTLLTSLEKLGFLQPATVEYTVVILMCKDAPPQTGAYQAIFTDAADVYHGNTDPDYARHATATAATKAEARCLRKALQLKGIAGEEKTVVPTIEAGLDGRITPEQVNFLNVLCRRNDVNLMKYINAGKKKYDAVDDVPFGVAQAMVEHLAGFENAGKVPDALRGYDPKWR